MKQRVVNQVDTEKLVAIRTRRMTRAELVVAVKYWGHKSIENLETGRTRVSDRLIARVCEVLEIDPSEIEPRERKRRAS
jgi:hypothetical protein